MEASGSLGAVNDAVALNPHGRASTVQLTGTFTATVEFEATTDGETWVAVAANPFAGGASVTSATAPGAWSVTVEGLAQLRARCSAFTSGAVDVFIRAA